MAAKSIAVARPADAVIAAIGDYADETPLSTPLQNGTRLKFTAGGRSVGLNVYPSKDGGCKVVFDDATSPQADEIAALLGGAASASTGKAKAAGPISPVLDDAPAWVGSDESGKGDYFGPLVVSAVALTTENWRVLEALGVRDSKSLTDNRASALAAEISPAFPHETITISPPRYNELWQSMGSVNRVLAWAHARAIEEVLAKAPGAMAAVADQFGDESLIRDALFKRGRVVQLVQMPRAERDPAVAAASILARAEFLRRLDRLGREAGVRLPKGASAQVDATARTLVAKHGAEILDRIAKRHFKTTEKVLRKP